MNNFKKLSIFLLVMYAMNSVAQDSLAVQKIDEVVIIATKFPTASKNVGKIVHKITAEELKEKQHKSVSQVLNEIPGFELNGSNSTPGKNIAAYVRGGKASQVLVVIDGIAVTDPSGINLTYNLNQIAISQIESIEVLKGAASTLYGTGAATAVIAIKTKKAAAKSLALAVGGSIKTNRTASDDFISGSHFVQHLAISGTDKGLSYLLNYSGTQAKGMSEAFAAEGNLESTDDPFYQNNYFGKVAYDFTDNLNLQMISSYLNTAHDVDGGAFNDIEENFTKADEYKVGLNTSYEYNQGRLIGLMNYKTATRDYDLFNSYSEALENYLYKSNSVNMDVYNLYEFSKNMAIISGIDIQQHNTDNETPYSNIDKKTGKFSLVDTYMNLNLKDFHGFNFHTGARLNWHNEYGTHTTFTLNPSYNINIDKSKNIKLLASYNSAYVVPSIYQLYSIYGNTSLTPEETKTFEVGTEYNQSNKISFSILYFDRVEENAIIFVTDADTFASNYDNDVDGDLFVKGIESALTFAPIKQVHLKTNYTYTKASKVRTHSIPKHKWNSSLHYSLPFSMNLNLSHQYVSERTQLVFSGFESNIASLDSYHVFDLSLSKKILDNQLFLSIGAENIFNKDYLETIGYATKGRNLSFSFTYNL